MFGNFVEKPALSHPAGIKRFYIVLLSHFNNWLCSIFTPELIKSVKGGCFVDFSGYLDENINRAKYTNDLGKGVDLASKHLNLEVPKLRFCKSESLPKILQNRNFC